MEYWSVGVLRQFGIAPRIRWVGSALGAHRIKNLCFVLRVGVLGRRSSAAIALCWLALARKVKRVEKTGKVSRSQRRTQDRPEDRGIALHRAAIGRFASDAIKQRRILSPSGFMDDEDADAPWVGDANEQLAESGPVPAASPDPNKRPDWMKYTLIYVDATVIPNYWAYAANYTLCDKFFSALTAPSFPNHVYNVAAQSGGLINDYSINKKGSRKPDLINLYFPSVIELLGNAGISWTFYSGRKPAGRNRLEPVARFQRSPSKVGKEL